MNCIHCQKKITKQRLLAIPSTRTCVGCSTEEKYSYVPITYHKTGNTIEVIKCSKTAESLRKASSRAGFGASRALSVKKSEGKVILNKQVPAVGTTACFYNESNFNEVSNRILQMADLQGLDRAKKELEFSVESRLLSVLQGNKIQQLLNDKFTTPSKRKVVEEIPVQVSKDILQAFLDWRK